MTPERIYQALTTGLDAGAGARPERHSEAARRRVHERPADGQHQAPATPTSMPNQCTANPPMPDPASGPSWNGWGNDLANTRFQPAAAARLTAARRAAAEAEVGLRLSARA